MRVAFAIACIFVSGPFFRYVASNYFLSTLMAMPVLLYLVWTTVQERADRMLDASLAVRFGAVLRPAAVHLSRFCSSRAIGLQVAAICLRLLAELQRRASKPAAAASLVSASRTLLTAASRVGRAR